MPKEKVAKKRVKPPRWTGLKPTPEGLEEWMRLANLVPPGDVLPELVPERPVVNTATAPHLRGSLILSWDRALERLYEFPPAVQAELITASKAEVPNEVKEQFSSSFLPPDDNFWRLYLMSERYNKIRTACQLREIASTKNTDPIETLVSVLRRTDLNYLRQCELSECANVFYATKSRQPGCSPDHSTKIRRKKKYKGDVESRHPKKRAEAARKR
jgi:hypothetical protein